MLELDELHVHFPVGGGKTVRAVDGVDLKLEPGETLGLVGESGSGKSTIGKAALRLIPSTSGSIRIGGIAVTEASGTALRQLRSKAQIIFQDPHSSLNPRMTIQRAVAEGLILNTRLRGTRLRDRVAEILEQMGLASQFLNRFPHELSGGQKQRVCIARALALDPDLLILDEPTSALDVSVQAQILETLKGLTKDRPQMTQLFISHNLAVVRFLCKRVAVMYLGRIVEIGTVDQVFSDPRHPYTRALLSAVPVPEASGRPARIRLQGDIPSPTAIPGGCPFHTRCPIAEPGLCDSTPPPMDPLAPEHAARCHFAQASRAA
ncbi:ABC transporter ATP-binding protein [uncultured Jannaschia sp.]|uniref:ABC transporter ATP-binding protein n=1 Tax=uncultured Jannaschia sp. TaxID=293347 RepID=UPI002608CAEB|nr:ABC transporter ATP-binding protein [uncultured Jannaschia sp.]